MSDLLRIALIVPILGTLIEVTILSDVPKILGTCLVSRVMQSI